MQLSSILRTCESAAATADGACPQARCSGRRGYEKPMRRCCCKKAWQKRRAHKGHSRHTLHRSIERKRATHDKKHIHESFEITASIHLTVSLAAFTRANTSLILTKAKADSLHGVQGTSLSFLRAAYRWPMQDGRQRVSHIFFSVCLKGVQFA